MSSFTEPLTVTKISPRMWIVERPFRYYIGSENSAEFVDIPRGFETDFASVPRGLWNVFPPDGEYTQAAVVHDFLYTYKVLPRKRCDEIFLEAMTVLNVPRWKRQMMFWAVRIFGGGSYKK